MANRISFRGVTLSQRTADMIVAAEKILGWKLVPTQGSYNSGGVAASAGTHDGGGAVDFRARDLTSAKRLAAVNALRKVGFAAWLRSPSEGNWPWHIHAIAVGDSELSRGARNQVTAYFNGRNGLANNGADNATRAYVGITWEKYAAAVKAAQQKAEEDKAKPVLHSYSINYATKGKPMNGQTLAEAKRFIAFVRAMEVITKNQEQTWLNVITKGDWVYASQLFDVFLRMLQARAKVVIDGKFGPQTGGFVDNYGYNVIYNG